ncbi:src substrate cortactin-like [Cavia porcellus]|uniref:src substrate cortactin-like n=1 Tax=Cavia porcellus TaxID=10141 RepID=UPI002FDFD077
MSSISSRQKQHKGNQMEILCNLIYASLIKNDVSKKEQRWGSKTLQGSRHQEHINIYKIRENVFQEHHTLKEKELQTGPKASHGYGGKFCVEQYSMDKEQAKAKKKTSTESPTPHPAEERQLSSPIYEDAASLNAEVSHRGPSSESEPERVYSAEATNYLPTGQQLAEPGL